MLSSKAPKQHHHRAPYKPLHKQQKRNVSFNKYKKIVSTKKRLMLEVPAAPDIHELETINATTSFDIPTTAVQFSHRLPHVDTTNHPLLHKPKMFDAKQSFAIIDINGSQQKVTKDDQIMVNHLKDVEVGEQLSFEHVYLLASRDYTVLGKPWVPNVSVIATVEEHTMLAPQTVWRYKRRTGERNLNRHRDHVTILRIDDIQIDDAAIIPDIVPLESVQINNMKRATDFNLIEKVV